MTTVNIMEAKASMDRAQKEVRRLNGAVSDNEIIDITVSSDGTWQKRGFYSLFVFLHVLVSTNEVINCFYLY